MTIADPAGPDTTLLTSTTNLLTFLGLESLAMITLVRNLLQTHTISHMAWACQTFDTKRRQAYCKQKRL